MNLSLVIVALLAALLVVQLVHLRITLRTGKKIRKEEERISMGLTNLQAAVTALTGKVSAVDADFKKLLANSSAGPGPGQVIVNQSDIDNLTASVGAANAVLSADDTAANPPAATPPAAGS